MPRKSKYEPKAVSTTIKCTSRVSLKIRDNFYTIEYGEERTIPEDVDVDLDKERKALWDTCNNEVDIQAEEIQQLLKRN